LIWANASTGAGSSGVILDHELHDGNPSDKKELVPLVKRFKKLFRRAPSEIATDKGYYSHDGVVSLRSLKVSE